MSVEKESFEVSTADIKCDFRPSMETTWEVEYQNGSPVFTLRKTKEEFSLIVHNTEKFKDALALDSGVISDNFRRWLFSL